MKLRTNRAYGNDVSRGISRQTRPANPEFEVYQILKKLPAQYSVLYSKRLRDGPPLIQILIQPVLFQKARKLLLCRSEPDLLAYSQLSEFRGEFRHLLQTGIVGRDESLLEIQKLVGLAVVERLHPPRFQIHLDSMVKLRQPLALKIVINQERDFPGSLMNFDHIRLRHVAKQCGRAADVCPEHWGQPLQQAPMHIKRLLILPAQFQIFTGTVLTIFSPTTSLTPAGSRGPLRLFISAADTVLCIRRHPVCRLQVCKNCY